MSEGVPSALLGDLFGAPLVSGFAYADDFLSSDEASSLIARIDAQTLLPFRFQGWLSKRLTTSFGWSYDFDRSSFAEAPPIPDWLAPIKARAAQFAGVEDDDLVQALLLRYDPGAGIGWHRDRPVFEHVVGISLGAPAPMRSRRRTNAGFDRASALLSPRSIYHLAGEVRHDWEHSIAEMDMTRWSITFRSFSARPGYPQHRAAQRDVISRD